MIKKYLNRVFIDGLSGMATGLFATLIIGTIIGQVGGLIGGTIGDYLTHIANLAKTLMGAGIGVGVACKLKATPLVTISAAVVGLVGAFTTSAAFALGRPGEPLGAFVAAYIAVEIGSLVSGKTSVDILVTPLVAILSGSLIAFLVGPPISEFTGWIGAIVRQNVVDHPIVGGMIVSVVMGICLTLPISSAAIGFAFNIGGLAGGAAVVGCCCNMIGFAVASFRENKWGGLVSQGIGTSMIQMPNIVRRPLIWLPAILSSAILGPIAATVLKLQCSASASGMGTSGLVGPIDTYFSMVDTGTDSTIAILEIVLIMFVAPAILAFIISEAMRKIGWIKKGDMRLKV